MVCTESSYFSFQTQTNPSKNGYLHCMCLHGEELPEPRYRPIYGWSILSWNEELSVRFDFGKQMTVSKTFNESIERMLSIWRCSHDDFFSGRLFEFIRLNWHVRKHFIPVNWVRWFKRYDSYLEEISCDERTQNGVGLGHRKVNNSEIEADERVTTFSFFHALHSIRLKMNAAELNIHRIWTNINFNPDITISRQRAKERIRCYATISQLNSLRPFS